MKLILSIIVSFLFYTIYDIMVWQRIFESNELWHFGEQYHSGWYVMLFGFIVLGAMLLNAWRDKVFYVISMIVLAFSGVEDILYYWLDGRTIPERLPWLDNSFVLFSTVTNINLVISSAFYIIGLIALHRVLKCTL